jgi:MtN3 and saliva related transmembrane protein
MTRNPSPSVDGASASLSVAKTSETVGPGGCAQARGAETTFGAAGFGQRQSIRLVRAPAVAGSAAGEGGAAAGAELCLLILRHDCHIAEPNRGYCKSMLALVDIVGALGAALTTLCWLPQALKVMREKETRALSLPATAAFTFGVGLWLIYGLAIHDWPLIGSNAVTLALMAPILAMKLRYG